MSDLTLGRDRLGDASLATGREWLVTNGIGGFAAGTVSGALTRRSHGLLIAALDAPPRRTLLLAKLAERLLRDDESIDLGTDLWASGAMDPRRHLHLLSFHLEDTIPVWTWVVAGVRLEKRVWMERGENTTCVEYALAPDGHAATLGVRALVNHRALETIVRDPGWTPAVTRTTHGLCVRMVDTAAPLWLSAAGAEVAPEVHWYRDYALPVERGCGEPWIEDHFMAGEFVVRLTPGERFRITASARADAAAGLASAAARSRHVAHERILLDAWRRARPAAARSAPAWVRRLVLSADAFVAARAGGERPNARSLLAYYPGLAETSRDALMALPGLTLVTGRADVARAVVAAWAARADRGLLPSRNAEPVEYRTADASLWLFQAVRAVHEATGDDGWLASLFPALEDIGAWLERGSRHGIGADPRDGLLRAGAEGLALTWMDACADGRPVTPRAGKPVEINALWYNALTAMAAFARRLGRPHEAYAQLARRVGHGFARYWHDEGGWLHDVIDGPQGADSSLRPNQLLAVSLPDTPLPAARRRAVLEACGRHLLTPYGLRTLAPGDPRYCGGDADAAAHQGSAWVWLLPHYALAHYRVHGDRSAAMALLEPLGALLETRALGQLPERVTGEPPHAPEGAIARAASVGEALRAWHVLAAAPEKRPVGRGGRTFSAVGSG